MPVKSLNAKFAAKGNIFFNKGEGGLIVAQINNKFADCKISLYGAHVLSYELNGGDNLLWMSKKSLFEEGMAIRGGIPLCFPWFGPHTSNKTLPQHGFARLIYWEVEHVSTVADGATRLELRCQSNDFTKGFWPFDFSAKLLITVGDRLTVELHVKNTGTFEFTYTDALHTYLKVGHISEISLSGLRGTTFYDGIDGKELVIQKDEKLHFAKEENRRYLGHSGECIIEDESLERKIHITKQGSNSTVVWNPWIENCNKMADMHTDGYKTMVCVEAANALTDAVTLKPGESHSLVTEIWSEKI